jgi:hypothetical protein
MSQTLSAEDVARFEMFLNTCLSHPGSLAEQAQLDSLGDYRELCARVMAALQARVAPVERGALNEGDFVFLESWLKARDLIVAGLQVLEMADPASAQAVQHERECTETAFAMLPRVLRQARHCLDLAAPASSRCAATAADPETRV